MVNRDPLPLIILFFAALYLASGVYCGAAGTTVFGNNCSGASGTAIYLEGSVGGGSA